jgi:hypothetical protein
MTGPVDMRFSLRGEWVPADHGDPLYAALLAPFPVLYSPLMVSGDREEVAFSLDVARRLARLGMREGFACGRRREVRVASCRVMGFSLLVSELSAQQSLALQSTWLAAGRRFGWGVFLPHRRQRPWAPEPGTRRKKTWQATNPPSPWT